MVNHVLEHRCWNRVQLHHAAYCAVLEKLSEIGSQMVCNAIGKVIASYKALRLGKQQETPKICFYHGGSVHYCARTFTLKADRRISLYSPRGRMEYEYRIGKRSRGLSTLGLAEAADLLRHTPHA